MTRRNSNYVHITCELVQKTEKAVKIVHESGTHWLPFSQMAPGEEDKVNRLFDQADEGSRITDVSLSISEWIAGEKGIDGDDD